MSRGEPQSRLLLRFTSLLILSSTVTFVFNRSNEQRCSKQTKSIINLLLTFTRLAICSDLESVAQTRTPARVRFSRIEHPISIPLPHRKQSSLLFSSASVFIRRHHKHTLLFHTSHKDHVPGTPLSPPGMQQASRLRQMFPPQTHRQLRRLRSRLQSLPPQSGDVRSLSKARFAFRTGLSAFSFLFSS